MARDRGEPNISHQVLFCPVIDHNFERGSYDEFAEWIRSYQGRDAMVLG